MDILSQSCLSTEHKDNPDHHHHCKPLLIQGTELLVSFTCPTYTLVCTRHKCSNNHGPNNKGMSKSNNCK